MATGKQIIQVVYKGTPVRVFTCLTPELAAELRGRWENGVVVLERLHETDPLRGENARTWLVQAVCQILKIKDWQSVDRECTGRTEYPKERSFLRAAIPLMPPPREPELPAQRQRLTRTERMRTTARKLIPRVTE